MVEESAVSAANKLPSVSASYHLMDEPEVTVKSATVAPEQRLCAEAVGAEGIPGAPGCALIVTLEDATEVLPV